MITTISDIYSVESLECVENLCRGILRRAWRDKRVSLPLSLPCPCKSTLMLFCPYKIVNCWSSNELGSSFHVLIVANKTNQIHHKKNARNLCRIRFVALVLHIQHIQGVNVKRLQNEMEYSGGHLGVSETLSDADKRLQTS